MSITPISPAEARAKYSLKTDLLIQVFNILIAENYNNNQAAFSMEEVKELLSHSTGVPLSRLRRMNIDTSSTIANFQEKGWSVRIDLGMFFFSA